MPRAPRDYRAVHAEADRFEPRLARAVEKALGKIRARLSSSALEAGLAKAERSLAGRSKAERRILARTLGGKLALAVLSEAAVKDALVPAGAVKGDAVKRGAKLGAAQVRKAGG